MPGRRLVRVRVALPQHLLDALVEYARRRGVSLDEALEQAIRAMLKGRFKRDRLGSLPNRCYG